MGQTVTKNTVDANISAIASVIEDAVQNCSQRVDNEVFNTIQAQDIVVGGNLVLDNENTLIVKQQCLQSEKAVGDLDNTLQASASQLAASLSQQLELSSSKAKNVIDINAQIASEIKNRFVQNCSLQGFNFIANDIKLNDDTIGGSIIINNKNYVDDVVNCSTQGSTMETLRNRLEVEIEQSAIAWVESFMLPIIIGIVLIIGLIALFLFLPALFGGKKQTPPQQSSDDGALSLLAAIGEEGGATPSRSTPPPSLPSASGGRGVITPPPRTGVSPS